MAQTLLWPVALLWPAARTLMLTVSPKKPAPSRPAPSITLPDGRKLAYEVRGNSKSNNVVFWNHGIISSRYEVMATDKELLAELDMVLIGIDRPSYGQSDSHPDRSFRSYVEDLEQLADHLRVEHFFVVGVSGGGPYAYAAAHYLPDRVRGIMTISTLSPADAMNADEQARYFKEMHPVGEFVARLSRQHRSITAHIKHIAQTYIGGRLLYEAFLLPIAKNCLQLMADNDRKCIELEHQEYTNVIVPESLRQGTAASFWEDLWLFEQPWSFDVSDIRPDVQRSIHIWHGTGDKQVPWVAAKVLHRLMPLAQLHIVEGGGHFAYYVCSKDTQRQALEGLLAGGTPLQSLAKTAT